MLLFYHKTHKTDKTLFNKGKHANRLLSSGKRLRAATYGFEGFASFVLRSNLIHRLQKGLQVLWLGQVEPVAEGDAHVFRGLFPVAFMVVLEREDVGVATVEQHFLQGAKLVDNLVE